MTSNIISNSFAPAFLSPIVPEAIGSSLDINRGATFLVPFSAGADAVAKGDIVIPYGASLIIGAPLIVNSDGEKLEWKVNDEHLQTLTDISQPVSFTYEVQRGSTKYQSARLELTLSNAFIPTFPSPALRVKGIATTVLPTDAIDVIFRVKKAAELKKNDTVQGWFNGTSLGIQSVETDEQYVDFTVNSSLFCELAEGQRIELYYNVNRTGVVTSSHALIVIINKVEKSDWTLEDFSSTQPIYGTGKKILPTGTLLEWASQGQNQNVAQITVEAERWPRKVETGGGNHQDGKSIGSIKITLAKPSNAVRIYGEVAIGGALSFLDTNGNVVACGIMPVPDKGMVEYTSVGGRISTISLIGITGGYQPPPGSGLYCSFNALEYKPA
ncbi:TPA: hypothetical protein QH957_002297 [Enterobacter bugandensis]|nr:hypothetical protein [Enterobacter bugandensis]